jgi:hypothetical protein
MPVALKIKRTIENDVWKIQFSIDLTTLPESDKELIRKFGEPQLNAGGTFGIAPDDYILPDKWIRVKSDLPYTQEFDSKSPLFVTNIQTKAEAYQTAFKAAYARAFTALRMKADTFTGEEIYNVITTTPITPVITSLLTASATAGTAFTYQIVASNAPESYVATNLPTGLTLNTTTGAITGTPTSAGTASVTIGAINLAGTGSASIVITTIAAPVITSLLTASATVGTAFTYQIVATNTPTAYSATSLPSGLSINTTTGAITGTPTSAAITTTTIRATNAAGTTTASLVITTILVVVAPVISSSPTASATAGTAFTYQITASNTPTSYNATGLPSGLSINTTTGAITGTPTSAGTASVNISATNAGGTGSSSLTITTAAAVIAPVITSLLTASATVGSLFTYQITASNTPTAYSTTNLPTWLDIDTATGELLGTPTDPGAVTVTIGATNAGGTGSSSLTINVAP